MLDARARVLIDQPLNRIGRVVAQMGVSANAVTMVGCALGLLAALAVALHALWAALILFVAGRIADGLDGAVSRVTTPSDRGGYLDIVLDFIVYAAIPLAFAISAPLANGLPAAALLAAIVVNGCAFLAFAVMAERRGMSTTAQGPKSLYYLAGIAEGTETIAAYIAMMLWPGLFPVIAYGFAALCAVSGAARIILAWQVLRPD